VNLEVTSFIPANYDTGANDYTIVLTRNQSELYINKVLRGVILHNLGEAIPSWENNPPITTLLELQGPTENRVAFNLDGAHYYVADGIPCPPRQYAVYNENTSTKWSNLATGGATQTSHPIPIWGYNKKTFTIETDAPGTLKIQVYKGGWRTYKTQVLTADEPYFYNMVDGVAPIARMVYEPTNGDTIKYANVEVQS